MIQKAPCSEWAPEQEEALYEVQTPWEGGCTNWSPGLVDSVSLIHPEADEDPSGTTWPVNHRLV